ncbi:MAG: carboxypeptidase regulatory-like domain-containing protein [Gemmatimonadota bacterium]|nr:MAG: carboxypeptidase regulatory-like domain-containing protein [Gemmatimonadota bacterium]
MFYGTHRPAPIAWLSAAWLGPVLLLGLLGVDGLVHAQQETERARLVGLVTDRLAQAPAVAAEIIIPSLDRRSLTNEEGWFTLEDLPPGEYVVEVRYLGLRSEEYEVFLPRGTTRVDFQITAPPFELEELVVEIRMYRALKLQDFERRRHRESGFFIDREEIEESSPLFISDLLRGIPGVRVEWTMEGNVRLTMGHGLSACEPDLYIDGSPSHAARINDWLPNLIEAVEIYNRGFDRPQEFYSSTNRCGAILLWTRERM